MKISHLYIYMYHNSIPSILGSMNLDSSEQAFLLVVWMIVTSFICFWAILSLGNSCDD